MAVHILNPTGPSYSDVAVLDGVPASFPEGYREIAHMVVNMNADFDKIRSLHERCPIARLDIHVPDWKTSFTCPDMPMLVNVIHDVDDPETEWYAREGVDELPDSDPVGLLVGGKVVSPLGRGLVFDDSFYLTVGWLDKIGSGICPVSPPDLLSLLLIEKKRIYGHWLEDWHDVQGDDPDLYRDYLSFTQGITIHTPMTFIPGEMLVRDCTFYSGLMKHGWKDMGIGLYLPGHTPIPPYSFG